MKSIENTEHLIKLVDKLKIENGGRPLDTNCFLMPDAFAQYIKDNKMMYHQSEGMLYLLRREMNFYYLYYYAQKGAVPNFPGYENNTIVLDFVAKPKGDPSFSSIIDPHWYTQGFSEHKLYQRMRRIKQEVKSIAATAQKDLFLSNCPTDFTPNSVAEISALWQRYLDPYSIALPTPKDLAQEIKKGYVYALFNPYKKIIGVMSVSFAGKSVTLEHLVIDPDYRRMGLADQITLYILSDLKDVRNYYFWVDINNTACIELNKQYGFSTDGLFTKQLIQK